MAIKKTDACVGFFMSIDKGTRGQGDKGSASSGYKKSLAMRPDKGPWLAKNDLGAVGPDRPTMKLLNEMRRKFGAKAGFFSGGLLGQDQFSQTRGLQAVRRAVVADLDRFLTAQQLGAVHAARTCAGGLRA
jgi:hypothetical protein